jgi:hypothetical protein
VDYLSALWEHEKKKSVIGNFQHPPQPSILVANGRTAFDLNAH